MGLPPRKFARFLCSMKELGLKTPSIHSTPCECEKVYTGQTVVPSRAGFNEHHHI
jgi:hypothetical protein